MESGLFAASILAKAGEAKTDGAKTAAPADAAQSVAFMAENQARCGWRSFTVVGHTDRSGSDKYNDGLAMRRARVIADMMGGVGIPADAIAVSGMGELGLVFVSLVCGTSSLSDPNTLGRLGAKAMGLFTLTTAIAIALAIATNVGGGLG